ncbi:hypothetical protein VYU27_002720 [Nannochloropsis oceanica]
MLDGIDEPCVGNTCSLLQDTPPNLAMSTLEVSDLPVPAKDERFPTINQALNCWNKYNEWVLCLKNNEKDEAKCFLPRFNMRELCPGEWVEKWDADRDGDKFAGLQVDDAEH